MPEGNDAGAPDVAAMQAELEQFRSHGLTHEQMKSVITHYVELVDENKAAPKTAPEAKKEEPKDSKKDALRNEMYDLVPGLKDLSTVNAKIESIQAHLKDGQQDAFVAANMKAEETIGAYLANELNVDPDTAEGKKFVTNVTDLVADAVYGRDALAQRLAKGDARVVKEVLQEFSKKGLFEQMKVPTKVAKTLPFQSSRNSPFKDTAATIQESLKALKPHERLREIGKQVYSQVIRKGE